MRNGRRAAGLLCFLLCLCISCPVWNACAGAAERLPDRVLMSFYDQSLIIGDSQMRNLGNYMRRKRNGDPGFFPGVRCYGEYSLQMRRLAQKDPDPNPDAIQLTYKGRTATLTGIAMAENPRNVFILIGLNDLIFQHIDRADNYIDRIVALRDEYFPETSLFFMSLTPVTAKRTRKQRDEIAAYNAWLEKKCGKIRAEYMDITAGLTDEQGWMPQEITADNDSHLNADGFDIFVRNLLDYAQVRYEQGLWVPDPALMKEGETPQ